MLTESEARRLAERWVAAWNRHDLEAVLSFYAEDAVLTSPMVVKRLGRADGTIQGTDTMRGYFATGLKQASHLRFELRGVLIGADGITILYRRESGALVADALRLDERKKILEARVFYGSWFET